MHRKNPALLERWVLLSKKSGAATRVPELFGEALLPRTGYVRPLPPRLVAKTVAYLGRIFPYPYVNVKYKMNS